MNTTIEIYREEEIINSSNSLTGNYSLFLVNAIVDLKIKAYENRIDILLRSVNLSDNNNKTFGVIKHMKQQDILSLMQ
jgi:hypothetical protein